MTLLSCVMSSDSSESGRPTFSGADPNGLSLKAFLLAFQAFLVTRHVIRPVKTETCFYVKDDPDLTEARFQEALAAFNRDRLSWFVRCLSGDALYVFQLMAKAKQADFNSVVAHMESAYEQHANEAYGSFISLSQQQGETIEAFAARLRIVGESATEAVIRATLDPPLRDGGDNVRVTESENPVLEWLLVQQFVRGLDAPPAVRQFAMEQANDPCARLGTLFPKVKKMLLSARAECAVSGLAALACGGLVQGQKQESSNSGS